MEKALSAYKDGNLKFNQTSRVPNIPKPRLSTGVKRIDYARKHWTSEIKAMDDKLIKHILGLESRFFGITLSDNYLI